MLYGDRSDNREIFFQAWNKHQQQLPLDPTEKDIVQLIQLHPEYQTIFDTPEKYLDKDFSASTGETNPFMHLGIHLSIMEQVRLNRPKGVTKIYQQLLSKTGNPHDAEHMIMEVLIEQLWQVMHHHKNFDEKQYIKKLKKLLS